MRQSGDRRGRRSVDGRWEQEAKMYCRIEEQWPSEVEEKTQAIGWALDETKLHRLIIRLFLGA